MISIRWLFPLLVCSAAVSGCAMTAVSSLSYQGPTLAKVENEAALAEPFSDVWDRLVRELSKSFFVINNVEKESRIINVSFSTDTPAEYADCGVSTRQTQFGNTKQKFVYNVAQRSDFTNAFQWGPYGNLPAKSIVTRIPKLEGRVNIYLAPQSGGTAMSVNTRYVLTVSATGTVESYNAFGTLIARQPLPPQPSSSISFDTSKPASADWGTGGVSSTITCQATGALEASILAMARPH